MIVDIMAISSPMKVEKRKVADTCIGTQRYVVSIGGEPVTGTDLMRWEMQFDQCDAEVHVRSDKVVRDWHTFGLEKIISEASLTGLQATIHENFTVPTITLFN